MSSAKNNSKNSIKEGKIVTDAILSAYQQASNDCDKRFSAFETTQLAIATLNANQIKEKDAIIQKWQDKETQAITDAAEEVKKLAKQKRNKNIISGIAICITIGILLGLSAKLIKVSPVSLELLFLSFFIALGIYLGAKTKETSPITFIIIFIFLVGISLNMVGAKQLPKWAIAASDKFGLKIDSSYFQGDIGKINPTATNTPPKSDTTEKK